MMGRTHSEIMAAMPEERRRRIEALAAEIDAALAGSRDNKLHFDVLYADYKQAIAERDALAAENERLREALRDIAKYDVGLQNLIDDNVYEETETSRYYAMNISWRQKLARKALDGETE